LILPPKAHRWEAVRHARSTRPSMCAGASAVPGFKGPPRRPPASPRLVPPGPPRSRWPPPRRAHLRDPCGTGGAPVVRRREPQPHALVRSTLSFQLSRRIQFALASPQLSVTAKTEVNPTPSLVVTAPQQGPQLRPAAHDPTGSPIVTASQRHGRARNCGRRPMIQRGPPSSQRHSVTAGPGIAAGGP